MLAWRCYDETELETRLATVRTLMLAPVEIGGRRVDVMLTYGVATEQESERPEWTISRAALAADHALSEGRDKRSASSSDGF